MIIMILLCDDNVSTNLSSFSSLETTERTVNETLYDMSTILMMDIPDNIQLVTDILLTNFTNIGKYFILIFYIS
jgi:hypothetical protein